MAPTQLTARRLAWTSPSFNGIGTFDLFSGTVFFGNNANLREGNSFDFGGDSNGNLDIFSANNFQNGWSFPVTNFALHDTISLGTTILATGTYTNAYDATAHTLTIPKAAGGGRLRLQQFQHRRRCADDVPSH